jgi:hypothetical protein
MINVNTHPPTNRTCAVIDGGSNAKTRAETAPAARKPKLLDQVMGLAMGVSRNESFHRPDNGRETQAPSS